jgi:hypothetical protein
MLDSILKLFPRRKGNQWKIQKIHELMHVARDYAMYGLPANFDAGWGERELRPFGKDPSKTCQMMWSDDYLWQINKRLYERAVVEKMLASMEESYGQEAFALPLKDGLGEESDSDEEDTYSLGGDFRSRATSDSKGRLNQHNSQWQLTCCGGNYFQPKWTTRKNRLGRAFLADEVCQCLAKEYGGERVLVDGYTEFYKGDLLFRSHPDYRSRGPWYEWAMVQFEGNLESENVDWHHGGSLPKGRFAFGNFPCKILAIFKCPRENGKIKLVVHPCTYSNHEKDSRLVECWELDYQSKRISVPDLTAEGNLLDRERQLKVEIPKLVVVELETVMERIYVIEEMPGFKGYIRRDENPQQSKRVMYVRDRLAYWPHHFRF